MRQLSASLYVHTWPHDQVQTHGCNHGFIVTSEGIVAIDSPYLPTDAVKWRDEIAKRGELCFIINTEHHRDHVTGCYFLPGIVISSQRMRDSLQFKDSVAGQVLPFARLGKTKAYNQRGHSYCMYL